MYMLCPWRPEDNIESSGIELQVVVSHHVGAGNQTIVLSASATDTLNPWV